MVGAPLARAGPDYHPIGRTRRSGPAVVCRRSTFPSFGTRSVASPLAEAPCTDDRCGPADAMSWHVARAVTCTDVPASL